MEEGGEEGREPELVPPLLRSFTLGLKLGMLAGYSANRIIAVGWEGERGGSRVLVESRL